MDYEKRQTVAQSVRGTLSEKTVQQALSDLGVFERNFNGEAGFASALWRSWGYTDADHSGGLWLSLIHPADVDRVVHAYSLVLCGEQQRFHQEYRTRTPDGRWRWIISRGQVIARDAAGEPLRYLGSEMDVSDRKQHEEELGRAKAAAVQAAEEAETLRRAGAIVASTLEVEKIVELVLEQLAKVVTYDTASVLLLRQESVEVIGGNGWANMGQVVGMRLPVPGDNPHSEVLARGTPLCLADVRVDYPEFRTVSEETVRSWIGVPLITGERVLGLLTLHKRQRGFFDEDKMRLAASFATHVAVALDNAQLFAETHRLAMTDHLTALATRRAFMVHADTLAEQAARYRRPLAVLMMDIDHFKRINDDHGHAVGDQVLVTLSSAARRTLRRADVLCRYGGEEFAALLPETDIEEARQLAERVRIAIEQLRVADVRHPISVSIGISSVRFETEHSVEPALQRADQALYMSKSGGRNRCSVA
ncbi:MAG: sensor domain-containing diguanylate cyclase [Spirochaetaceae bacterium]|nr:MAG: sensor domain-containing diguanylate cyclase [Spirochaetaceae bacterium]